MKQAFELLVSGPEADQKWARQLPDGETCVGRAPQRGWSVTWDRRISREHFTLHVRDGMLGIRCLPTAANPILRPTGGRIDKSFLAAGDSFRVGKTMFFIDQPDCSKNANISYEFSWEQLVIVRQLNLDSLADVTEAINSACDSKTFAATVGRILVEKLDHGDRVAVVNVDKTDSNDIVKPLFFKNRQAAARHQIDYELLNESVSKRTPVLHLDRLSARSNRTGQHWAYCVPVKISESEDCWRCICVSGRFDKASSVDATVDRLMADVSLAAQLAQLEALVK